MGYLHTAGQSVDLVTTLGWGLLTLSCVVVIVVSTLLLAAIFRRRGAAPSDALGRPALVPPTSQLSWIYVGVAVSVVALLAATVWTFWVLRQVMSPGSPPAITIQVNAHRWWWEARYDDGTSSHIFSTANELHVPVGQPVRIELVSDDVIHSFWVPQVAGKVDVIPGRTNVTWIQATTAGRFRGQCAEFCGLQHAHMALFLVAEPVEEFRAWWQHQLLPEMPSSEPQSLFQGRCGACHAIRGTSALGISGPDLSHFATRSTLAAGSVALNERTLSDWLKNPQAIKPGTLMPAVLLTDPERAALVNYLLSLH